MVEIPLQQHIKEALKDLEKFKESKIWKSLYFKCFICEEIIPIALGTLLEGTPESRVQTGNNVMMEIRQTAEVCCIKCVDRLPKAPIFEWDGDE